MKTSEIIKWCGLTGFLATTIIGQAELIGEPARHYVTVFGAVCTAICGYLIQHKQEWDGFDRRQEQTMPFDWGSFVMKVPDLIKGGVAIAQHFKKPGPQKKIDVINGVIDAVPEGVVLVEHAVGKDVFNDAAIAQLLSASIDAERAAQKAHEALQAGLLAKAAKPTPA